MTKHEIFPATRELLAMAGVMRTDWDQRGLEGTMAAASHWPWPKACLAAVRWLCDPASSLDDLRAEVTKPTARTGGPAADPHANPEAAAMLEDARARIADRKRVAGGAA